MSGAGYKLGEKYEGDKRKCCACGLQDAPIRSGEIDADGNPVWDHKVVLDLVYLKRDQLTRQEKDEGFSYVRLADQHAMVRAICRPCLQEIEDTRRAWKDFKEQQRRDAENSAEGSFYFQLCR